MLCFTIIVLRPSGPVATWSVGPNIATVGTFKTAAMCIRPESLVAKKKAAADQTHDHIQ